MGAKITRLVGSGAGTRAQVRFQGLYVFNHLDPHSSFQEDGFVLWLVYFVIFKYESFPGDAVGVENPDMPSYRPRRLGMGFQPLTWDTSASCAPLSPRNPRLDKPFFLTLFTHKGLKYQRPNPCDSPKLLDDLTHLVAICLFCTLK